MKISGIAALALPLSLLAAPPAPKISSTWLQDYSVQRQDASGLLTLSTPYYSIQQNLKKGGVIASIRLTHGKSTNFLTHPIETRLVDEHGTLFSDLQDSSARITLRKDSQTEIVTVESRLVDETGRASGVQVKTVFEYHWGYIKVHKEFKIPGGALRARQVCPLYTMLTPSLTDYGYREGRTEEEGAPPFSFGSYRWGKLVEKTPEPFLNTRYVPRSMIFADAGVEGLEWFAGSDLAQWDLQLTGRRGQGQIVLQSSQRPPGFALSLSPWHGTNSSITLPRSWQFDFYLGLPLLEGHAQRPWFHASFNRNRGNWVTPEQIRRWAESGLQTVHCHNDGDYYDDGLFWRDGSYPPYPDMARYDQVIAGCHQSGIRVATYFSNKELHPSTREFQEHGLEWGRKDRQGNLQHNFFRGKSEFGAQMCLRSGWLEFLKSSIDRVLKNHPLDGVYYDWNVALYCCTSLHEGKKAGETAAGHWDIDELLNLMEWTRRRLGPGGLIIVHNTTTPMFVMENFADFVVANEWGYGKWKDDGPALKELPLEWSLVGARSRGVISYGQIDRQAPRHLHRIFALEALLGGVTPWPASPEAFELAALLKPLGDFETYQFRDWRNKAVSLQGDRCGSAVYSRPGEAYFLLANLRKDSQEVHCTVYPDKLPHPLAEPSAAILLDTKPGRGKTQDAVSRRSLDVRQLCREGVNFAIPGDSAVVLHLQSTPARSQISP